MSFSCCVLVFLPREHQLPKQRELMGSIIPFSESWLQLSGAPTLISVSLRQTLHGAASSSPGGHLFAHVTCSGKPRRFPGSVISLVRSPLAPPYSFFYPNLRHETATTSLALSGLRALAGRPSVGGPGRDRESDTEAFERHDGPVEGGPRMGRLVP